MIGTERAASAVRAGWAGARPIERVAYGVGAVLLLSGLAHLGVQAVRGGPWEGPVSWRKPTTFGLSFGLTVLSVTWVASFVRLSGRTRGLLLGAFLVASVEETALVSLQAWRGVPSHFDFASRFDASVSMSLAAGGGVLFVVLGGLFVAALRAQPGLDPVLRDGLRCGFAALLGGLVVGAVMIGIGSVLVRRGDPEAAYHGAGVLKLAHAVGLHGIAVLPGLAWLSGRAGAPAAHRRVTLRLGVLGYAIVLLAALVVGATGLTAVSLAGLAVGGSVLVSAMVRATVGSVGERGGPDRVVAG